MARKVLIADDSESIRGITRMTLEIKGYEIVEAGDGVEACEWLTQNECDLLITDLAMPRMTGAELLARTRKEKSPEELPVIVFTAEADADRESLVAAGANAFLKKPFSPIELIELVESLIGPAVD
jgi:CheY-like chemotaxis protein